MLLFEAQPPSAAAIIMMLAAVASFRPKRVAEQAADMGPPAGFFAADETASLNRRNIPLTLTDR
jgi:hypothetical protein